MAKVFKSYVYTIVSRRTQQRSAVPIWANSCGQALAALNAAYSGNQYYTDGLDVTEVRFATGISCE